MLSKSRKQAEKQKLMSEKKADMGSKSVSRPEQQEKNLN